MYAMTAEDLVPVSMVERNINAKTAEDLVSVSMEEGSIYAKTAEDLVSVSMEERSKIQFNDILNEKNNDKSTQCVKI